jgi:hypothetical protein
MIEHDDRRPVQRSGRWDGRMGMGEHQGNQDRVRMAPSGPMQPDRPFPLLVVVLAAVIVCGLAVGILMVLRHGAGGGSGSPGVLQSLASRNLPNESKIVRVLPLWDSDDFRRPPDPLVSSALAAAACGGVDLALQLLAARRASPADLERNGVLRLFSDPAVARGLRCGEQLRRHLARPEIGEITFQDQGQPRRVNLLAADTQRFLDDGIAHNFSGFLGYCTPTAERTTCDETGPAGFRDRGDWILGGFADVEVFARSASTAREEVSTAATSATGSAPGATPGISMSSCPRSECD